MDSIGRNCGRIYEVANYQITRNQLGCRMVHNFDSDGSGDLAQSCFIDDVCGMTPPFSLEALLMLFNVLVYPLVILFVRFGLGLERSKKGDTSAQKVI